VAGYALAVDVFGVLRQHVLDEGLQDHRLEALESIRRRSFRGCPCKAGLPFHLAHRKRCHCTAARSVGPLHQLRARRLDARRLDRTRNVQDNVTWGRDHQEKLSFSISCLGSWPNKLVATLPVLGSLALHHLQPLTVGRQTFLPLESIT